MASSKAVVHGPFSTFEPTQTTFFPLENTFLYIYELVLL